MAPYPIASNSSISRSITEKAILESSWSLHNRDALLCLGEQILSSAGP